MKNLCRENTLPRSEEASRVRGWILGNTKIGPVLDVKVCLRQKRYGIEVMVGSLFRDRLVSWVRIVNGIDKCVTETSETTSLENVEHRVTETCCEGKATTKAHCDTVSQFYSSSWKKLDGHQSREIPSRLFYSVKSLDQITATWSINSSRRWYGAARFDDIMEEFKAQFDGTSQSPISDWITCLAKGGGPQKRFQYCLNPDSSKHFLYFRAIQGHSGGNLVDPALQHNVLLLDDFGEVHPTHIGNANELHSIIKSGLIPGGRSLKRDRQTVLFTAVNPMDDDQSMEEIRCDLDKPKIAPYKNTWSPHQNTVYWCNLKLAQKKGLQFYQTRSHAIVLYNTPPAICIEKAVCMKTEEELHHKVYQSPRLPRVALKPNSQSWQQDQPEQEARKSSDQQSVSGRYGKPAAATLTVEYQAYLILQSNNRTRIAKKRSKSWFSSSRIIRTRSLSCRT